MTKEAKERLANRFYRFPVLYMLVRTLLFGFWFRVAFVGFLLLPVVLVLVLAKIWRTTPPGFNPEVRMSAVDWLQARSLRQTALANLRSGEIEKGLIAYNLAIANHPGNLDFVRGFLGEIIEHVQPPQFQGPALSRSFWLLGLSHTNLADLELTAEIFRRYGLDEHLIDLLEPKKDHFTPSLQKVWLATLFENGLFDQFDDYWRSLNPGDPVVANREVQLYRAAFESGWGSQAGSAAAVLRLEDFLEDPEWRVLANRLYLRVCEQKHQVEGYVRTLERLESWKATRLIDHVRHWRLLAGHQRAEEAVRLALAFDEAPATGLEIMQLAQAYLALGLRAEAQRLLDSFTLQFSFLDGLWVLYSNLLIESAQWDKVRQLALQIRMASSPVSQRLAFLSYYLQGRAELAQRRLSSAQEAFANISQCQIKNLNIALAMARALRELGEIKAAAQLLKAIEPLGLRNSAYWNECIAAAFELKERAWLVQSAAAARDLRPGQWQAVHNYAAALLTSRQKPEEAIRHTFQLVQQFPQHMSIRLNHGLALIQNGRYAEAEPLLASIPVQALTPSERSIYHYACFETLLQERRHDVARLFWKDLDPQHLFPVQREHLRQLRQSLPDLSDGDGYRVARAQ